MTDTVTTLNSMALLPIDLVDPRVDIGDRALVEASRNGFPIVARTQKRGDSRGLAAGASVALLLGGLTFWSMSGHRDRAAPPAGSAVPAQATAPVAAPPPPSPYRPVVAPTGLLLPHTPPLVAPPVRPDPAQAPTVVFDATGAPAATAATGSSPAASGTVSPKGSGGAAGLGDNEQFASRIGGSSAEVASAEPLTSPATTVVQGTLIPAVLETAIDTDLPGYVRAVVSQDVRSFDGSRVVVPRSSRLVGQYKSGLSAGQTRAYIIWSRLIRPDGASVALASPAVDFAGRSGLDGKVDGHFMKRFGSAVLLSVVGGLSAIGNAGVLLSGGQSAASVAAQRDTQIPPTVRVLPGEPIRIFTARDLDFSTVLSGSDVQ